MALPSKSTQHGNYRVKLRGLATTWPFPIPIWFGSKRAMWELGSNHQSSIDWCQERHLLLLMEEILDQWISRSSHYLQGFTHPRWCRISSTNSKKPVTQGPCSLRSSKSVSKHRPESGVPQRILKNQNDILPTNDYMNEGALKISTYNNTTILWNKNNATNTNLLKLTKKHTSNFKHQFFQKQTHTSCTVPYFWTKQTPHHPSPSKPLGKQPPQQ